MNDSTRRKLFGVEAFPHLGIRHPRRDLDWAGWATRKRQYEAMDRERAAERKRLAEELAKVAL